MQNRYAYAAIGKDYKKRAEKVRKIVNTRKKLNEIEKKKKEKLKKIFREVKETLKIVGRSSTYYSDETFHMWISFSVDLMDSPAGIIIVLGIRHLRSMYLQVLELMLPIRKNCLRILVQQQYLQVDLVLALWIEKITKTIRWPCKSESQMQRGCEYWATSLFKTHVYIRPLNVAMTSPPLLFNFFAPRFQLNVIKWIFRWKLQKTLWLLKKKK